MDKRCQGLVQPGGEIFPAGIPGAAQGDKGAGEVDPPHTVLGYELVIGNALLLLHGQIAGSAGELRRGGFHTLGVAGEFRADGLLEIHRQVGGNGEDLREAELADHLGQLVIAVRTPFFVGKHGNHPLLCVIFDETIIAESGINGKWPERGNCKLLSGAKTE